MKPHQPAMLALSLICLGPAALAQSDNDFGQRIQQAMQGELRSEAEIARDGNRQPAATLEFFGIDSSMKVLELIPGGGWYTKLLAPALRDSGQLYVALGTGRVESDLLNQPGFDQVKVIDPEVELRRTEEFGLREVEPFSLSETGFDAALTFRNMHNFNAKGRDSINRAVFEALKPGGIYGVVDHTRRHMESLTRENRRRADPVQIIQEVLAAGFEFIDYADLHFKPDDELRYEVGRKSVTGNTDRFTLLFRKPE